VVRVDCGHVPAVTHPRDLAAIVTRTRNGGER
jgi:hypothetical protein